MFISGDHIGHHCLDNKSHENCEVRDSQDPVLGSSGGEAVRESKAIVTEAYNDVPEGNVHEKHFDYLQCHHSTDVDNLASFWLWYIRMPDHVREQITIHIDDEGEDGTSEGKEEAHAKVKECMQ